mgnify:CR=1 FL=1
MCKCLHLQAGTRWIENKGDFLMKISRRNFLAVAGAAAAAAALTACSGSSASSTSTASSAAASTASSAAEGGEKIVKVALTCDTGTIDDESFNQACWTAVSGYMGDDCQYYIPEADASDEDRETMIRQAVNDGADVIVCVGYLYGASLAWAADQYPDVKFYSQASPFIEFFSSKSRLGNNRKMYAHLRKDAVDVYGYERGRLLLANSFECRSTPDRVYYLLYIWKQLGFEQERDELHLTGDLNDKELLLPELRKFIRQVFIMNPATNLDLQAITLCE